MLVGVNWRLAQRYHDWSGIDGCDCVLVVIFMNLKLFRYATVGIKCAPLFSLVSTLRKPYPKYPK